MDNMDIINRIDEFLASAQAPTKVKYIPQEDAISILECVVSEVSEDRVLLETVLNEVKRSWSRGNAVLMEDFYKILEYYGVIGESDERKTILETKGKAVVRRFVNLKSKERILRILCL